MEERLENQPAAERMNGWRRRVRRYEGMWEIKRRGEQKEGALWHGGMEFGPWGFWRSIRDEIN
jgi:hypothetical protein